MVPALPVPFLIARGVDIKFLIAKPYSPGTWWSVALISNMMLQKCPVSRFVTEEASNFTSTLSLKYCRTIFNICCPSSSCCRFSIVNPSSSLLTCVSSSRGISSYPESCPYVWKKDSVPKAFIWEPSFPIKPGINRGSEPASKSFQDRALYIAALFETTLLLTSAAIKGQRISKSNTHVTKIIKERDSKSVLGEMTRSKSTKELTKVKADVISRCQWPISSVSLLAFEMASYVLIINVVALTFKYRRSPVT